MWSYSRAPGPWARAPGQARSSRAKAQQLVNGPAYWLMAQQPSRWREGQKLTLPQTGLFFLLSDTESTLAWGLAHLGCSRQRLGRY